MAFVDTIISKLGEAGKSQYGLYVGCGDGRNFVPLLDAGLHLSGIDISAVGLQKLSEKRPDANVMKRDFSELHQANVWDYVVALQAFQHGDRKTTHELFAHASEVLRPGGQLFFRVNSVSTEIYHDHKRTEGNKRIGKTVLYKAGSKEGMQIHFFARGELEKLANANNFDIILPLYEVTEERQAPKTGTWTQWESIWQKR